MIYKISLPVDKIFIFIAFVAVLFILLKFLKVSLKLIIKLAINALLGGLILLIVNYIPQVNVPVQWWSLLLTGIFGIPAAVILIVIYLLKK